MAARLNAWSDCKDIKEHCDKDTNEGVQARMVCPDLGRPLLPIAYQVTKKTKWMNGWMHERTNEQMNERMKECMNVKIDQQSNQSVHEK